MAVDVGAVFGCAHEAGKGAEEEQAYAGHAGADYADVYFDCGPVADGYVVPWSGLAFLKK